MHTCTGVMRLGKHGQTSTVAGQRDGCQYYFTFFEHLSRKTYLDRGLYYTGHQLSYLIRPLVLDIIQIRGRQKK